MALPLNASAFEPSLRNTAKQIAFAVATNVLWKIVRDQILTPSAPTNTTSAVDTERELSERYIQVAPQVYVVKEIFLETALHAAAQIKKAREAQNLSDTHKS